MGRVGRLVWKHVHNGLEACVSRGVVPIFVGMVLERELAVSLCNLPFFGAFVETEDAVVVQGFARARLRALVLPRLRSLSWPLAGLDHADPQDP